MTTDQMWRELETLERKQKTDVTTKAKTKARKPRTDAIPAQAKEFLVGLLEAKNDAYENAGQGRPYTLIGVKGKYVLARRGSRKRLTVFHLNASRTKLVVSKLHRCTGAGKLVAK